MLPEAWYGPGRRFEYRGHPIWYRTGGDAGPWLLLIHGFPTASWDWHRIWAPLIADGRRLVALDLIGFGASAKPRDYDYTLMDQADLCLSLLEHLGIERIDVLAHDYGDSVAQELLARAADDTLPVRVERCCLLNGGIIPGSHRPTRIQKWLASPLGPLVGRLLNRRGFDRAFASIFGPNTRPSSEELATCWELVIHNGGKAVAHRLIRYMAERERHARRWIGVLERPPVPIRLINGLLDPVSGAHVVAEYRRRVADADVVELPDIGHYPQLEAPHAVLEAVLDFLAAP